MKALPNYLKQAIDTEVENAHIRGQRDMIERFAILTVRVKTYKVNKKVATKKQCLKLLESGFEHITKDIQMPTKKSAIIARMEMT